MISLNLQSVEPLELTASPDADAHAKADTTTSSSEVAAAPQPDLVAIAEQLRIGLGNRYEIQEPLAIGGMSTVLQLRHRLHGGLFVAKVLHTWLADQPEIRSRFREEAMHGVALAGQSHVVPVIDLGEVDGLFYLLMPYVDGEDLDRVLQRVHRLERPEILTLAAHMTSALLASEQHGIVHCDISPGNIRLDRYGIYRLMDFGLARRAGDTDPSFKGTARTPLYASPEQWRGEAPDTRSDLYSLGVVLLEAATGASPFLAESDVAIERKHLAGKWAMPPALKGDDGLAILFTKLLATDKENRMQSAAELAAALAGLGHPLAELRAKPLLEAPVRKAIKQRNRLSQLS